MTNNGSQPYAGGGPPMQASGAPRPQPQQRRRRRTRGGSGERGRGLEVLKDMQQLGAALDPTERLILELPPGKGDPPYGDRITGRAIVGRICCGRMLPAARRLPPIPIQAARRLGHPATPAWQ